jgi:hypothetical protein
VSQWELLLRFDITGSNKSALKQRTNRYMTGVVPPDETAPIGCVDMHKKRSSPERLNADHRPPTSPSLANQPPRAPQVIIAAYGSRRRMQPHDWLPERLLPPPHAGVTCWRRRNLE